MAIIELKNTITNKKFSGWAQHLIQSVNLRMDDENSPNLNNREKDQGLKPRTFNSPSMGSWINWYFLRKAAKVSS